MRHQPMAKIQESDLETAIYQVAELSRLATCQETFIQFIESEIIVAQRKQSVLVRKLEELQQERSRLSPGLIQWMEPPATLPTENRIRLARIHQMESTIIQRLRHLIHETQLMTKKRRDMHHEAVLLREEIQESRRKTYSALSLESEAVA